MEKHLYPHIHREIRDAVAGLPLYGDGPGVDYTHAEVAYAANVTLLYDEQLRRDEQSGLYAPAGQSEVLVVQRGTGDGTPGRWSGVSGYVDTVSEHDEFDPVAHTARSELAEECGMTLEEIDRIDFIAGERFYEHRQNGSIIHVLPLLGVVAQGRRPAVAVDGRELIAHSWTRLDAVAGVSDLSPGYLAHTLPKALGGLGLHAATVQRLLGLA